MCLPQPAHNFGPSQNQSQQARPQYNYTFRATQHGNRPASHPRQQQPYIQGGSATGNPPVMYPTLVYPQMTMPSAAYPQQRGGQGYYQYLPQLHYSYGTPPNHTQSCEYDSFYHHHQPVWLPVHQRGAMYEVQIDQPNCIKNPLMLFQWTIIDSLSHGSTNPLRSGKTGSLIIQCWM